MRSDLPTVPLEAGAGPDNPPCPVCGEPLFVWVDLPVDTGLAHRCEACGLGVMGKTGTTADAIADLERDAGEDGAVVFENKASLQSFVTGGAWSGLGTDHAYRFTPESILRLIATRDQVLAETRTLHLSSESTDRASDSDGGRPAAHHDADGRAPAMMPAPAT